VNLVRWLEHEGYDVSYQTDVDTGANPDGLLDHRLVIVAGHDEYWTKRMRDAFDAARDAGTNLAFTGSNAAYWQVRYEDGGRTIVGYKDAAPDPEPDPSLKTIRFRSLTPPRPECALEGVMFHRIQDHIGPAVDYTVTDAANTDPWFNGTGFKPGDKVLDVVGSEWDSLPEQPEPGCNQPGLVDLFHYEGAPQNADAVRYTAASGARIFSAGAQQWSWSLDPFNTNQHGRTLPADTRLEQFMRNALDDLTRPAPPIGFRFRVQRRTVTVRVVRHVDPRVQKFEVFRLRGTGTTLVCRAVAAVCVNRRLRPGRYRFEAVALDEWGQSYPTLSRVVVVRKRR
jgi:hypothetical protein